MIVVAFEANYLKIDAFLAGFLCFVAVLMALRLGGGWLFEHSIGILSAELVVL